jgi:hypothetical protein
MNILDLISEYKHEIILVVGGAILSILVVFVVIGWKRMNWATRELAKMYSAGEKSWFGKKRIESGIAFIVAESGAVAWLVWEHSKMNTTDFVMWLTPQLFMAGWYVSQIQKEKITGNNTTTTGTTDNNQQPNNNG